MISHLLTSPLAKCPAWDLNRKTWLDKRHLVRL